MTSAAEPDSFNTREALSRLVLAGVSTAIIDGLFSTLLSVFAYDSSFSRLFQGVASVIVGAEAFTGGASTTALGLLMHCGVAFGWSAIFILAIMRWRKVRAALAYWSGALGVAAIYGPAIWMIMSLILIPVLAQRPPAISFRWWVQFVGHFPFVGLPIVLAARKGSVRRT